MSLTILYFLKFLFIFSDHCSITHRIGNFVFEVLLFDSVIQYGQDGAIHNWGSFDPSAEKNKNGMNGLQVYNQGDICSEVTTKQSRRHLQCGNDKTIETVFYGDLDFGKELDSNLNRFDSSQKLNLTPVKNNGFWLESKSLVFDSILSLVSDSIQITRFSWKLRFWLFDSIRWFLIRFRFAGVAKKLNHNYLKKIESATFLTESILFRYYSVFFRVSWKKLNHDSIFFRRLWCDIKILSKGKLKCGDSIFFVIHFFFVESLEQTRKNIAMIQSFSKKIESYLKKLNQLDTKWFNIFQ